MLVRRQGFDDYPRERPGIGQTQVRSLPGQWMYGVRSIADQRKTVEHIAIRMLTLQWE